MVNADGPLTNSPPSRCRQAAHRTGLRPTAQTGPGSPTPAPTIRTLRSLPPGLPTPRRRRERSISNRTQPPWPHPSAAAGHRPVAPLCFRAGPPQPTAHPPRRRSGPHPAQRHVPPTTINPAGRSCSAGA